jgi:hypothetical protein
MNRRTVTASRPPTPGEVMEIESSFIQEEAIAVLDADTIAHIRQETRATGR